MRQHALKGHLAVAGGIALVVLFLSFTHVESVGGAGSAPVHVVNTPLPVQGTVNVGNFPTSSTVSGSVMVSNFPATQLTRDADNQARSYITIEFDDSNPFTVPDGKILVIEEVSATGFFPAGFVALEFDGDVGPASKTHRWARYFAPVPGGAANFSYQTRIYAEGGQTITYHSSPAGQGQIYAQGYLVSSN